MRVLLVNDCSTPTAGAEIATRTLRDELLRRGYDVRVFSSRAQLIAGEPYADDTCFGTTSRLQTALQPLNPSAYLALRRVLREQRPEWVHLKVFLWQLSPAILPLLRDVPTTYHVATYKAICPTGLKTLPDGRPCSEPAGRVCRRSGCVSPLRWTATMLQLRLLRRWRHHIDRIVGTSTAVQRALRAEDIPCTHVIPNAVPPRAARPPLHDPPTVAFAGRLSFEKGVDVLLEAFAHVVARLPEAQLLLAGEGPLQPRITERIHALGLDDQVNRLGQIPYETLPRRLASAWVMAVPSLWAEPFGLVAVEAMLAGTAVVASATGGLADIVQPGETGLLVPPGDARALADALLELLTDRERAEQLGCTGREVALAAYDPARIVDRWLTLHAEIVSERTAAPGDRADVP